jgi:hypothetical protein
MCIICVELDKNKLSPWEAKRNLREMSSSLELNHIKAVEDKISELIEQEIEDYDENQEESCEICGCGSCECDWRHC